jgi:hypothetical protein
MAHIPRSRSSHRTSTPYQTSIIALSWLWLRFAGMMSAKAPNPINYFE